LPHDAIDRDIEHITSLGVKIKTNTAVGKDITLEQLHEQYDAVYLSTGLHLGRGLGFDAEQFPGVRQSIDLLREISLGHEIPVPRKAVVIGGGNVAMDIARSLARLQKQHYDTVDIHVLALESEAELPCDREEFIEAQEEGITVSPSYGPKEITYAGEQVTGADFVRCVSVFDEQGRFSPKFDESERIHVEADMVIESIGQGADLSYIPEELKESLAFTPRGRLEISDYGQTSVPWLFAGGDIVRGPDAINGIADGHRAAQGIDAYLSGRPVDDQ
jgi:glutamate synthase (NADPH/NADH) small chain